MVRGTLYDAQSLLDRARAKLGPGDGGRRRLVEGRPET